MSNPYFEFKQFTVRHDRCAMKVGTDGVLLGAWADVEQAERVLDIGTGTGLIALMVAQRSRAQITAIDIDKAAVAQARENVAASPWKDRVGVECSDICQYSPGIRFDALVSNPPYFVESLKCPDVQRNLARHTDTLDFGGLMEAAARLLTPEGTLSVIIPAEAMGRLLEEAFRYGFHLSRRTWVRTKPSVPPRRVLLALTCACVALEETDLTIELSPKVYSDDYIALTKDFYLRF